MCARICFTADLDIRSTKTNDHCEELVLKLKALILSHDVFPTLKNTRLFAYMYIRHRISKILTFLISTFIQKEKKLPLTMHTRLGFNQSPCKNAKS